jgi:spore maturation protein CgeB
MPEDPLAVMQGIRSLLALSEDARHEMGQRGKNFVLRSHTYPVLAECFLNSVA